MTRLHLSPVVILLFLTTLVASCASGQQSDSIQPSGMAQIRLDVRIDAASLSCSAMESAEFEAVVSGGDGDYSYVWDFNAADGHNVDGIESVAHYIYPEPGGYTISLHVADSSGASGEAITKINVGDRKYAAQEPIELYDLISSPDKPYIIDGFDITNPDGNGITLRNCENIIIRNCYIHDCIADDGKDCRAISAEGCRNLTIQNVYVKNNKRGILVEGYPNHLSSDILVENSVVVGSLREDGISFRNVENVTVSGNILYDNGRIWEDRISGISFNSVFHHVKAHHNLVVNSNSDGIELMGDTDKETATDIEVYANVVRDNGEQGVWLFRVQKGRVHHNYIEGSHNNGVCLEGLVADMRVDHNVIIRCGGTPEMKHHGGGAVAIQLSSDNLIQHNILIDSSCGDVSISGFDRPGEDWIKKMDSRFREATGNVIDGNVMCNSEFNISIADGVSSTSITNNVVWQRERGRHYHGCRPDKSNIKAKPLFRAPERGDFALLSNSPGYKTIAQTVRGSGWHFGTLAFDYKYVPLIMDEEKIARGFEMEAKDAAEAGAYWIRPHLTELFAWGFTEKQPGQYDWAIIDLLVRTCQKYDLRLLPQIWTLAAWDQKLPPVDMSDPMNALFTLKRCPWTHGGDLKPKDMKAYLAWLEAMVERYDNDGVHDMPGLKYPILYYEILNEPQGRDDMQPFFEVQKESYLTIKDENPDVQVVLGGQISPEELETYLNMGIREYCDVINIHGSLGHRYQEIIKASGGGKPVWITEIGYEFEEYSFENLDAERKQAEYLIKDYARSFANGADKIFWIEILGWITPDMELEFQLPIQQQQACLHPAGQRPRLAYYTHKLLASKIGKFSSVERTFLDEGVESYKFLQDGKIFYILWNESDERTWINLDVSTLSAVATELVPQSEDGSFKSLKLKAEDMNVQLEIGTIPVLVELR